MCLPLGSRDLLQRAPRGLSLAALAGGGETGNGPARAGPDPDLWAGARSAGAQTAGSVAREDDLAAGVAGLDQLMRTWRIGERKQLRDNDLDDAGRYELADLSQLIALGAHDRHLGPNAALAGSILGRGVGDRHEDAALPHD